MSSRTFNRCGVASGGVIRGDLDMKCKDILNVQNLVMCSSGNIIGDTIGVIGNLDTYGNLQVLGFTQLQDVDVSGNLQVLGNTQLQEVNINTLDVSENLNVSGNVDISGYLSVIDISNSESLLYLNNINILNENSIVINTVNFDVDFNKDDDFEYLIEQIDKPTELLPDDLVGENKWGGAVLTNYKNIFMIPSDSSNVIEFDTGNYDTEINRYPILDKPLLKDKWKGSSLAKNEIAVGVPYNHDKILKIQTVINGKGISLIDICDNFINEIDGSYNQAWISATITPNNSLFYMAPGRAKRVLTFDYITNDVSGIELPLEIKDLSGIKYSTTLIGPNKNIYMFPRDVCNVLIIDTNTNDISYININIPNNPDGTTTDLFYGGVLATNKKMYIIPYKNKHIMEFNPADNSYNFIELPNSSLVDFNSSKKNWNNGVLFKNGKVYGIPNQADVVLEFDPNTHKTRYLPLPTRLNKLNKYIGGIITDTEVIYGIPKDEDNILEINFGEDTIYKNWMVNSYFNKV